MCQYLELFPYHYKTSLPSHVSITAKKSMFVFAIIATPFNLALSNFGITFIIWLSKNCFLILKKNCRVIALFYNSLRFLSKSKEQLCKKITKKNKGGKIGILFTNKLIGKRQKFTEKVVSKNGQGFSYASLTFRLSPRLIKARRHPHSHVKWINNILCVYRSKKSFLIWKIDFYLSCCPFLNFLNINWFPHINVIALSFLF